MVGRRSESHFPRPASGRRRRAGRAFERARPLRRRRVPIFDVSFAVRGRRDRRAAGPRRRGSHRHRPARSPARNPDRGGDSRAGTRVVVRFRRTTRFAPGIAFHHRGSEGAKDRARDDGAREHDAATSITSNGGVFVDKPAVSKRRTKRSPSCTFRTPSSEQTVAHLSGGTSRRRALMTRRAACSCSTSRRAVSTSARRPRSNALMVELFAARCGDRDGSERLRRSAGDVAPRLVVRDGRIQAEFHRADASPDKVHCRRDRGAAEARA